MTRRVLVAGGGIAGISAAFRARQRGCEVMVVSDRPGASALGSGAVDDLPWEQITRAARTLGVDAPVKPIADDVAELARALGIWDLPADRRAWIATLAGRIRPARGRDLGLLDLGAIGGGEVVIPRIDRAGWDADAIAAALGDDPFARARKIGFVAIDLPVLRFDDERRIPDGDLAARHDDDGRIAWLATRLREGIARRGQVAAVLLGPFLGAKAARSAALSASVGAPVGEALAALGSPAGLRFEVARDRLLRQIGARRVRDRVVSVDVEGGVAQVTLAGSDTPVSVEAVVLAIGGVAAGGVIYAPPEHDAGADLPPAGRSPFTISVRANVTLSGITSSLHGPELDLTAWPSGDHLGALEAAGVRCDGVLAGRSIAAAGDVIAGRPRTVLEAVGSGLLAGSAAALDDR